MGEKFHASATIAPVQPLREGQTISRYRIEAYLGGGGMADVYLVEHADLGVKRALKVLKRGGTDLVSRMMHEGRLQARLSHPNLVPVLELVEVAGQPALIMDFVDGPSLDVLLATGRLSEDQADHIARGVLDGMVAAHDAGVVHRDLKPGNIMLDLRRRPPAARVTDFGLAKAIGGDDVAMHSTASGMLMGTPRYMAPEQFRDAKRVDQRADVWSMGAVLYELLTGAPAFPADSLADAIRMVDDAEFAPVESVRPDAPSRMLQAIEDALVPDPELRCASMAELRDTWIGDAPRPTPTTWQLGTLRPTPQSLPASESTLSPSAFGAAPAETAPTERRSGAPMGILAAAVGIVALVAGGAGVWALQGPADVSLSEVEEDAPEVDEPRIQPPEPTVEASEHAPQAAPPDVEEPAAAAAKPTPERARPAPRKEPTEAATEPPGAPDDEQTPAEPAAPASFVSLARVPIQLRNDRGAIHEPGTVPPGTYRIHAEFKGEWVEVYGGRVTVGGHQVLEVRCNTARQTCTHTTREQ